MKSKPKKWLRQLLQLENPIGFETVLRRCRARLSNRIATIVDVGASNGSWSLAAKQFFPDAKCLLIEAQAVHRDALETLSATRSDMHYVLAAAGHSKGEIDFDATDPWGGVAAHHRGDGNHWIRVPMTTVDAEVEARDLSGPYLLKLDTHGFELPIFEGAEHTLEHTELIVVETYNFRLSPDAPLFYELCAYLERKGFRCVDMLDPLFRPRDNALWQVDLVFVPIHRLPLDTAAAGGYR